MGKALTYRRDGEKGGDDMSYYRVCPYCGSNLDPGENCDCRDSVRDDKISDFRFIRRNEKKETIKAPDVGQLERLEVIA